MNYNDQIAKICRLENGFEVEIYDPPPPRKADSKYIEPYREPWKSYAFGTAKEAMAFLQGRLEKLKSPNSEYADGFKEATKKK